MLIVLLFIAKNAQIYSAQSKLFASEAIDQNLFIWVPLRKDDPTITQSSYNLNVALPVHIIAIVGNRFSLEMYRANIYKMTSLQKFGKPEIWNYH